jgi:hypothetical protein
MLTHIARASQAHRARIASTSRAHRKHIARASQAHRARIASTSRAHLSPIYYTSIEHEFTKLSLHHALPLSFIFEIKEEKYALYHRAPCYHHAHVMIPTI